MKNRIKMICVVLVASLLYNMMPMRVFAGNLQQSAVQIPEEVQKAEAAKPVIVEELVQKRSEYGKQFRLTNGLFLAVEYPEAVHFQKNGSWEEIDNTLTAKDGKYMNTDGAWRVRFPQQISSNNSVEIEKDGYTLSFALTGQLQNTGLEIASAQAALVPEGTAEAFQVSGMQQSTASVVALDTSALRESAEHPETVITKNRSALTYQNVFANTHIRYDLQSNTVKESIELQSYNSQLRGYRYTLNTGDMIPVLEKDNSIRFYTPDQKQVVMVMPAPFMVDANMAYCPDVRVTLTGKDGIYTLTYLLPQSWLADSSRAWPVILDPVVKTESTIANIVDQNVYSLGYADPNAGVLQCGYAPQVGISRAYLKYNNLPDLDDADVIVGAKIRLWEHKTFNSTCCVSVHKVLENWTEGQMQWKSRADYDPTIADYMQCLESKGYTWDITDIARGWYEGENTGVMFKLPDEVEQAGGCNYIQFWSADFSIYQIEEKPTLFVYYRSNVGIEPYYSYATLGAGSAGTAYIADATGQLKVAKKLVSYASTINPFAINLFYNSDYFNFDGNSNGYLPAAKLGINMELGHGWTLDVIQHMKPETIDGVKYLDYTDGDGTIHYFARVDTTQEQYNDYDPNLYYDEDGLGLKIEEISANNYIMSDDKDNTWTFTNNLLTEISDASGNKILINYENKRITTVQQQNKDQTPITIATFAYSGNVLQSVTDAAGNVYTLVYTNGELTSIKMGNITVAEYTYNTHRVTSLKDTESGYTLTAQYDSKGKVDWYKESVSTQDGIVDGVEVDIEYENANKTTYRDYGNDRTKGTADDILTSYLFDYWGHTANVYTTDAAGNILGASNAVYSANDEVDKRNNRTLRSASIGVAAQQLLLNSGFEDTEENTWILSGAASIDNSAARTGNKVLKFGVGDSSASRTTLPLTAGKTYTLSGYINTNDAAFASDALGVRLQISDGTEPFPSEAINYATSSAVDDGWVRVSVTFEALQSVAHTVTVSGTGIDSDTDANIPGYCYVDDLQLEVGEAPSNRNLLENGNMETANYAWTHTDVATVDATTPVSFVSADGRNVLRILGNPESETTSSTQTVMLNLPGSQTYVLSGWVKADAVPDSIETNEDPAQDLNKQCGLRAVLHYADDNNTETEETEYHYAAFNSELTQWQFTSLTIVPKQANRTVEKMDVVCAYERNANIAYFDNLSLVREVAQTYTYDEDGNLVSVTTTGLKEDVDTYENGNLIRSVTGGNGTYTYEYDETNKQRLIAVKHNNITQSMGYDTVGNVTSTTLTNTVDNLQMVTGASYTNNQNLTASVTDTTMQAEYFSYDTLISLMYGHATSTTDAMGTVTSSTYNNWGHITEKEIENIVSLEYNYEHGDITEIIRTDSENNTQSLIYQHNLFDQLTNVCIDNISLASFTYGPQNGNLITQTYGSGENASTITFSYDDLQRTTQASYSSGRVLKYFYAGDGELYKTTDNNATDTLVDDLTYFYTYDSLDRLIICRVQKGTQTLLQIKWEYDNCNRVTKQSWQMGNTTYSEGYVYSATDGNLTSITLGDSEQAIILSYDNLQRLDTVNAGVYTKEYDYRNINNTQTTSQVALLKYSGNVSKQFGYSYNALGNIATYQSTTEARTAYEYDELGQLTSALSTNRTGYQYEYDTVGNILSVTHGAINNTYTYGNTSWRDLLTAFNGKGIAYEGQIYNADENTVSGNPTSGNPISYYNGIRWNLAWTEGNKLVSATNPNNTITYTYDANGQRTSKTVNGIRHDYIYASSKLLRESITNGTNVITLDFRYDDCGYPFALTYTDGNSIPVTYYYITNLQGDVMSLVTANGTEVAAYTYDPYGKVLTATGSMALVNPLCYRNYYYDTETGFYYLLSRYYDPAICRFISADSLATTGQSFLGYNAFAYCGNNPVNRSDDGGGFWETVFDVVTIGFSVADVVMHPKDPWAWVGLAGDLIDLIPFVCGVGETIRAVSTVADVVDVMDDIHDTAQLINKTDDILDAMDNIVDGNKALNNLDLNCPNGNGYCFVAGTQVLIENGTKNIEDIEVGDLVWAWDETTCNVALKCVVRLYRSQADELIHLFVEGEEIVCTPGHRFYSPTCGWIEAKHLNKGDVLFLSNGIYVFVEHIYIEIPDEPVTIYNFEVQDFHTYFVGNSGVLVHNKNCFDYELEEIINNPQSIQNYTPQEFEQIAQNSNWNFSQAKNGKGSRAYIGDYEIRYNMNGTRLDAEHFGGDPYWIVSSSKLGKNRFRIERLK